MISHKDKVAEGSTSDPTNDSMAPGMLNCVQGMPELSHDEVANLCTVWREAHTSKGTTYRNLIKRSHVTGWENFLRGARSIAYPKPIEIKHFTWSSHSDASAIYDDWVMVGHDLCDAILKYTITEHGRSAESESESENTALSSKSRR